MEIRIIHGVYNDDEPDDIKLIGTALLDRNGEPKKCQDCNEGVAFVELETGKTKCTRCAYTK